MGVWPTNDLLVSIPIIYWRRPKITLSTPSAKGRPFFAAAVAAATATAATTTDFYEYFMLRLLALAVAADGCCSLIR